MFCSIVKYKFFIPIPRVYDVLFTDTEPLLTTSKLS
nr:MAG TPA: hypothetical protein [Crassvirales sp.]